MKSILIKDTTREERERILCGDCPRIIDIFTRRDCGNC